jgi:hypothetical protein
MHFSTTIITLAGTWSLWHFLNNLQANTCITNMTNNHWYLLHWVCTLLWTSQTYPLSSLTMILNSTCLKTVVLSPPQPSTTLLYARLTMNQWTLVCPTIKIFHECNLAAYSHKHLSHCSYQNVGFVASSKCGICSKFKILDFPNTHMWLVPSHFKLASGFPRIYVVYHWSLQLFPWLMLHVVHFPRPFL